MKILIQQVITKQVQRIEYVTVEVESLDALVNKTKEELENAIIKRGDESNHFRNSSIKLKPEKIVETHQFLVDYPKVIEYGKGGEWVSYFNRDSDVDTFTNNPKLPPTNGKPLIGYSPKQDCYVEFRLFTKEGPWNNTITDYEILSTSKEHKPLDIINFTHEYLPILEIKQANRKLDFKVGESTKNENSIKNFILGQ